MRRRILIGPILLAVLAILTCEDRLTRHRGHVQAAERAQAPIFEVDPIWPKPLPHHWILGAAIGVSVDAQDHIWIVHRPGSVEEKERYLTWNPPAGDCCAPAPAVLEFDEDGTLIGSWGGPGQGYEWPVSLHGITVDYKGNLDWRQRSWFVDDANSAN